MKTINYDESKVPKYELPSPLITAAGKIIDSSSQWCIEQRAYILKLFEDYIYGQLPPKPDIMNFEVLNIKKDAFKGIATRKEICIKLKMNDGREHNIDLLLYVPNKKSKPAPVFVGLNFLGNHSCSNEKDLLLSKSWFRSSVDAGIIDNRATEAARGHKAYRWPVEQLIDRGYALATVYYGDLYPDGVDKRDDSIYKLFDNDFSGGAISAWAWGLSRVMDYFEADDDVCHRKVTVMGHSRLGKAALWAGAQDQRFAITISNDSGCAGAALTRHYFGETIECLLGNNVGYWCTEKLFDFINEENKLPIDQHALIGLLAPRPAYIASAKEDLWADPTGEFLSAVHAAPVYNLFGSQGLGCDKMPPKNRSIQADIGYHVRSGEHDITEVDWNHYLNFADKHLREIN